MIFTDWLMIGFVLGVLACLAMKRWIAARVRTPRTSPEPVMENHDKCSAEQLIAVLKQGKEEWHLQ